MYGLEGGIGFAAVRARALGHVPCCLEGNLDSRFSRQQELPRGSKFPVDFVYVPKEGVDWSGVNITIDRNTIERLFHKKPAMDFY